MSCIGAQHAQEPLFDPEVSPAACRCLARPAALCGLKLTTTFQRRFAPSRAGKHSYPTLEKADAVIFQFSRIPGLLNSAVAAGEESTLAEARQVLQEIASKQQELQGLLSNQSARSGGLNIWRTAVQRYAENALSSSAQLVNGSASFDTLRPNLDRMVSDLAQAQNLASAFRANAYANFRNNLAQTRKDNATTTRMSIILCLALVAGDPRLLAGNQQHYAQRAWRDRLTAGYHPW